VASTALLGSLLAAFGGLAACGQRGPLTLPGAEPAASEASSPPGAPESRDPTTPGSEDDDEPIQNER
jgi:predicted small lipoprotein YifL